MPAVAVAAGEAEDSMPVRAAPQRQPGRYYRLTNGSACHGVFRGLQPLQRLPGTGPALSVAEAGSSSQAARMAEQGE